MAAKTSWHRYGTKLRHGHPMCNAIVAGRRNRGKSVSGWSPNFWGGGAVLPKSSSMWQTGGDDYLQMEVTSICLFLLCTKLTKLVDVTGDVRELVRTRIAPPGGRYQRHLVVCTQNSSGITCTHLSGRFGQIDYHYKLQDSKKCVLRY